jgi:hypothetical protein
MVAAAVWPKAIDHRSLGQRPRMAGNNAFLAEGQIHTASGMTVNMAFGQGNL